MDLIFPWQVTFDIGDGFDVISGQTVASGTSGLDVGDDALRKAPTTQLEPRLTVVSNEESGRKAIEAKLAVAGSGLGWNASAEAAVKDLSTFDLKSVTVQRAATVWTSALKVSPSQTLSDQARAYLDEHGPEGFRAVYGTHFISGKVMGGSFIGSLRQSFSTEQAVREFDAKLSGTIDTAATKVEGSAELSVVEESFTSSSHVQGSCFVRGGSTDSWRNYTDISTLEDLRARQEDFFASFGTADSAAAVPIVAIVSPWSMLDSVPAEVSMTGPSNVNQDAELTMAKDRLISLEYLATILPPDRATKDSLLKRREDLSTKLTRYLGASRSDVETAAAPLQQAIKDVDDFVDRSRTFSEVEVEYSGQHHIAHKKELDSLTGFRPNQKYPTVKHTSGTVTVKLGQIIDIATFVDDNGTHLRMAVTAERDPRNAGRIRVGAYFGYSGQAQPALQHPGDPSKSLSDWAFATVRNGSSEWTERAYSMRNDGQRDNCFVSVRAAGHAAVT